MPWYSKQPDLKNDPRYLEPRITENTAQLAQIALNTKNYGAIGDGLSHPLSEVFPTIELARMKYPNAISLNQEIDEVAIQHTIDYAESLGGGTVLTPKGIYLVVRLFVGNKVNLQGEGILNTILKLPDNTSEVLSNIPTGIYCKSNIEYYSIENLTYDGNAENNIDISTISAFGYNNTFAQGIVPAYVSDDLSTVVLPKMFDLKNLYIKNTVRNGILTLGGTRYNGNPLQTSIGHVDNITIENAYSDHFIYESGSDTFVIYNNITLKGFWRGSSIVAEQGNFNNVKMIDVALNPCTGFNLMGIVDVRSLWKDKTSFKNINIETSFTDLYFIIKRSTTGEKSIELENLTLKQTDNVAVGYNNAIVNFFHHESKANLYIKNLTLNNVNKIRLFYDRIGGSKNVKIDDVLLNYSETRVEPYDDHLFVLEPTNGEITQNFNVKNIKTNVAKSPPLMRSNATVAGVTYTLKNIYFDNVLLDSNTTQFIFDFIQGDAKLVLNNFNITNSSLNGYKNNFSAMRDEKGINFINDILNGQKTNEIITFTVNAGVTESTMPYSYSITPRMRTLYGTSLLAQQANPFVSISNSQIKLTFSTAPQSAYTYQIKLDF